MGKFVLGVIFVALVQIAFVVYTTRDTTVEISTNTTANNGDEPSTAVIESAVPTPADIDQAPTTVSIATPSKPRQVGLKSAATRHSRPAQLKRNGGYERQARTSPPVARKAFEAYSVQARYVPRIERSEGNTVILYNYNNYKNAARSAAPSVRSERVKEPKRRSLIAKAVPILKAPWYLMKAVAARLN